MKRFDSILLQYIVFTLLNETLCAVILLRDRNKDIATQKLELQMYFKHKQLKNFVERQTITLTSVGVPLFICPLPYVK